MDEPKMYAQRGNSIVYTVYSRKLKKYAQKSMSTSKWTPEEIKDQGEKFIQMHKQLNADYGTVQKIDRKVEQIKQKEEVFQATVGAIEHNIPFEEFHIDLPNADSGGWQLAFIAASRSGKSSALRYIESVYSEGLVKLLMTDSPHAQVYQGWEVPKVQAFQPEVIFEAYRLNLDCMNHYPFLFMLDDIVTQAKYSPEILKLLTIYRNSNIRSIICVQDLTLLNPAGRQNLNYVFLGKLNANKRIKQVIEDYLLSEFPSKMSMQDMIRLYQRLTDDYHFIVIDNFNGKVYRTKVPLPK